jgi:hypothetical protein
LQRGALKWHFSGKNGCILCKHGLYYGCFAHVVESSVQKFAFDDVGRGIWRMVQRNKSLVWGRCSLALLLSSSVPVIASQALPLITQPASETVAVGDEITLNVSTLAGQVFSFQWQFNGSDIPGATAAHLKLSNAQVVNAGDYQVLVSDFLSLTPSVVAHVTVCSQARRAWVARYDGPASRSDTAIAAVVDRSGNVYVTGTSFGVAGNFDYATIKYDGQGNPLWVARFAGINGDDSAAALAVDPAGNVYVTGYSIGPGGNADYATVKYGPAGNQLWVARYDGIGGGFDFASALAVDGAGNVYVTGQSDGLGSGPDYATIKYDAQGKLIWVARYDGPGGAVDSASALMVDGAGNVYVTGYSAGSGAGYDYATIKYDPKGNQLWVARYDGPGGDFDFATALTLDNGGHVYVAGRSVGAGTGYDYATVKYDGQGNQLWLARYDGPNHADDSASALVVDQMGNVYVTGASLGQNAGSDYATIKYDDQGNQLWVARYHGPGEGDDSATALAVDSAGNVYVTGASAGPGTGSDYATVKYDREGNQLWAGRYDGSDNGDDHAYALQLDGAGEVCIVGSSYGGGSLNYATIKYVPEAVAVTRLDSVTLSPDGQLQFRLLGEAGRFYAIQTSPDSINWTTATILVNTNGAVEYIDVTSPAQAQRFYRVVKQP